MRAADTLSKCNSGKMMVSTHDIFPLMKDTLQKGHRVKFTVSGTSMLPWIAHNRDQVELVAPKAKELNVGDIILFQTQRGDYILHRIYKKDLTGFRTIGDACLLEDGVIKPEEIIGVVNKIYRKGRVIDCNLPLWKGVFTLWRLLLPIREYLLKQYVFLGKMKRKYHNIRYGGN